MATTIVDIDQVIDGLTFSEKSQINDVHEQYMQDAEVTIYGKVERADGKRVNFHLLDSIERCGTFDRTVAVRACLRQYASGQFKYRWNVYKPLTVAVINYCFQKGIIMDNSKKNIFPKIPPMEAHLLTPAKPSKMEEIAAQVHAEVFKTPQDAYKRMISHVNGTKVCKFSETIKACERLIATDAKTAVDYAILTGKEFAKGHAVISQNKDESFRYVHTLKRKEELIHKAHALYKSGKANWNIIPIGYCEGFDTSWLPGSDINPYGTEFLDVWKHYFDVVTNDPLYALDFANIIGERFHQGEKAIAEDGTLSLKYANEVVKGRFKEGEPEINKLAPMRKYEYVSLIADSLTPKQALEYIKSHYRHIQAPKDLERRIATDSSASYDYAWHLRRPFELGEDAIAKKGYLAHAYALSILKGAFPKGEKAIAEVAVYSFLYAKDVLKKRFIMAENKIKTDSQCWKQYTKLFGINHFFMNNYFLSITVFMVFCMMIVVSMARLAQGGSIMLSVTGMLFGVFGVGIILAKHVKKDKPTLT